MQIFHYFLLTAHKPHFRNKKNHIFATKVPQLFDLLWCTFSNAPLQFALSGSLWLSLAHSGSLSGSLSHILAHYGSLRRSSADKVLARLSTSRTHGHSLSRPANFIYLSTTTTTTNTTTIIIIITRPQPAWPRVDRLALSKLSWVHSRKCSFFVSLAWGPKFLGINKNVTNGQTHTSSSYIWSWSHRHHPPQAGRPGQVVQRLLLVSLPRVPPSRSPGEINYWWSCDYDQIFSAW